MKKTPSKKSTKAVKRTSNTVDDMDVKCAKPTTGTREHNEWLVRKLRDHCEELGLHPNDTRRDGFIDWSYKYEDSVTKHDLDTLGGWTRFRQYAADQLGVSGLQPSELGQSREVQHINTRRRLLERYVGDVEAIALRLQDSLAAAVRANPPKISNLKKPALRAKSKDTREIVMHVSDTHFGQHVDPREVLNGEYNWVIASRRLAKFCADVAAVGDKTATLRMILNGDLLEGRIHDFDRGQDMLSDQIIGTQQLLVAAIDYLRHHYHKIHVECQTGNHERWPFRGHGRPTAQKYDSATTVVVRGIEQVFRSAQDVTFNVPKSPFSVWESKGWRFMATHGDDVLSIKNPGNGISTKDIFGRIQRLEAGGATNGRLDCVMVGHWHFPLMCRIPGYTTRQPYLIVNGCMTSKSPFGQTLGLADYEPIQTFWEVTAESPVNHFRMSDLGSADKNEELNKIIPVPVLAGEPMPKVDMSTEFYAYFRTPNR